MELPIWFSLNLISAAIYAVFLGRPWPHKPSNEYVALRKKHDTYALIAAAAFMPCSLLLIAAVLP